MSHVVLRTQHIEALQQQLLYYQSPERAESSAAPATVQLT